MRGRNNFVQCFDLGSFDDASVVDVDCNGEYLAALVKDKICIWHIGTGIQVEEFLLNSDKEGLLPETFGLNLNEVQFSKKGDSIGILCRTYSDFFIPFPKYEDMLQHFMRNESR